MNETKYDNEYREKILNENGSIWIYDTLYLFFIPPVSLISLIGNVVSYSILSGPYFTHKPLYTYVRAICLNSSVINFITLLNIIWMPRRHIALANSEFGTLLQCYLKFPIIFSTYLYGCILDIVLAIERLFELTNRKHIFRSFKPNRVCFVSLAVCCLINLPLLFFYEPKRKLIFVYIETNQTEYLSHFGETEFALSRAGKVLKNSIILIRDVLPLIFLIITNIVSLVLFRRIYCNKECPNVVNLSRNRPDCVLMVHFVNGIRYQHNKRPELIYYRNSKTRWYFSVSQANKMLSKMILIICGITSVEHVLVTFGVFLYGATSGQLRFSFLFFANVATLIKNSSNIFIFYNYNQFFKIRFLKKFPFLFRKN